MFPYEDITCFNHHVCVLPVIMVAIRRYCAIVKETLVNKILITNTGEKLKIVHVDGIDLDDFIITTNKKKMYQLSISFNNGFLKFDDDNLNKILENHLSKNKKEPKPTTKTREESLKKFLEKTRVEEEKKKNGINTFSKEFSFLSNSYDCSIKYKGRTYRNSEAAFQAQKDPSRSEEFTNLTPGKAKDFGKHVIPMKGWMKIEVDIMTDIVRTKFFQHSDLAEKLLATDDKMLIDENTKKDTFWGVYKGVGQNRLGRILMKVREELRHQ